MGNQSPTEDQIDFIARTVVHNSERIEHVEETLKHVVTKEEHQEVMNALDTLIKLSKKKDEELTMMSHAL